MTDHLDLVLSSIRDLDYLYGANTEVFQESFERADDKSAFLTKLIKYFVMRPEKAKLIDTPYFERRYGGQPAYDAIIGSANYGAGRLERAEHAFSRQVGRADGSFFPLILSRIECAKGDVEAERKTLDALLSRFPTDADVILSSSELSLRSGNPGNANRLLDRARNAVENFLRPEIDAVRLSAEDLEDAILHSRRSRPGSFDVYDDETTRATWLGYFERFVTQSRYQSGDGFLIDYVERALTKFIAEEHIGAVLDFGSLCAEIIARPAAKLPQTKFVGIDRQEFVAQMNYEAYDLPNMSFESGDILDYLPKFEGLADRKLLFHVRTSCLLYPDLLIDIYSACAKAGVDYIMFFEGDGLSRHTLRYADFGDMSTISTARKGVLFNHNYKEILARSGYKIIAFDRVPSLLLCKDIGDLVGSAIFVVAQRH